MLSSRGLHTSRRIYSVWKVFNGLQLDLYQVSKNSPTSRDYVQQG